MSADFSLPNPEEFQQAVEVLRGIIAHTPLVPLRAATGESAADDIHLKLETFQPVTSFKIRGVFHAVARLNDAQRAAGLSTVSAGNTAQALAWAGTHFGVAARSIMPDTAPASKVQAVRDYGGEPILVTRDEVFAFLREHKWEQEPYAFIHPWTNRDVMIGHGTMALEILAQMPDVESVFVPVGGGGLLGGVGSALKRLAPAVKIFAVEPQACAAFHESLRAGKAVAANCQTICDGVAVPYMTDEMFPLLRNLVTDCLLVSEEAVKGAISRLAWRNKLVVEPSGALAAAAALQIPNVRRGKSVCLVTGGSVDRDKFLSLV